MIAVCKSTHRTNSWCRKAYEVQRSGQLLQCNQKLYPLSLRQHYVDVLVVDIGLYRNRILQELHRLSLEGWELLDLSHNLVRMNIPIGSD